MNSFIKLGMTGRKTGSPTMLLVSTSVAFGAPLASMAAFADPVGEPPQSNDVKQDDYFHTGAGARYLKRAVGSRRGISAWESHRANGVRRQHHCLVG